jgi:hypothetical protein
MRDLFSQYQSRINYNLIAVVQFARDNFLYISRAAALARPLNRHYAARSSLTFRNSAKRNEFREESLARMKRSASPSYKSRDMGRFVSRARKSRSSIPGYDFSAIRGFREPREREKTPVLRDEKTRFGET